MRGWNEEIKWTPSVAPAFGTGLIFPLWGPAENCFIAESSAYSASKSPYTHKSCCNER